MWRAAGQIRQGLGVRQVGEWQSLVFLFARMAGLQLPVH